ncbi:MAG: hypothetical protein BEN19_06100 [Epulopiscium sp. Nuni2H_MBin003]|nr:MAG: hypothetical protein BEN19_06100 [Epulopiscium sp. Nuni2H_MBin003]
MKNIASKLGDSLKSTYKEVSNQTQHTLDFTKDKAEIIALKNDLKRLYLSLGICYFDYKVEQIEFDEENLFSQIDDLHQQIYELENILETTKKTQKDSFSEFKHEVKSTWQEESNVANNLKFCANCNMGNPLENTICSNCETSLD